MLDSKRTREKARLAVSGRGLAAVAGEIGIGQTALHAFLRGAEPLARTADRIARWAIGAPQIAP
jgi:hypothetical protein